MRNLFYLAIVLLLSMLVILEILKYAGIYAQAKGYFATYYLGVVIWVSILLINRIIDEAFEDGEDQE